MIDLLVRRTSPPLVALTAADAVGANRVREKAVPLMRRVQLRRDQSPVGKEDKTSLQQRVHLEAPPRLVHLRQRGILLNILAAAQEALERMPRAQLQRGLKGSPLAEKTLQQLGQALPQEDHLLQRALRD